MVMLFVAIVASWIFFCPANISHEISPKVICGSIESTENQIHQVTEGSCKDICLFASIMLSYLFFLKKVMQMKLYRPLQLM